MYYHKAVHTNFDDNKTVCNFLEKISLHPCIINKYMHIFLLNLGVF